MQTGSRLTDLLNVQKLSPAKLCALMHLSQPQLPCFWQRSANVDWVLLSSAAVVEIYIKEKGLQLVVQFNKQADPIKHFSVTAQANHLAESINQLTDTLAAELGLTNVKVFHCFSYELGLLLQGLDVEKWPKHKPLGLVCVADAWAEFTNTEVHTYCPAHCADSVANQLQHALEHHLSSCKLETLKSATTFKDYNLKFEAIQDYLHAGDAYQVNFAQQFCSRVVQGSAASLLAALDQATKAPFAGACLYQSLQVLSCSPELFIEFSCADNQISLTTKPIKGTIQRSADPAEDQKLAARLLSSDKDKAENLMIVDLLRNDLGAVAKDASVQTTKLFELQSFEQVHHLVSSIKAELKDTVSPLEALLSSMPGGSITGAPKKRVCEIISELEATHRGFYCGSMGVLNPDGSGVFNLLIRTIEVHENNLTLWAGGGITVASEVHSEFQECLTKVSGLAAVLNAHSEAD